MSPFNRVGPVYGNTDRTTQIRQMMAAREADNANTAARPPAAPLTIKQMPDGCIYLRVPTFEDATNGKDGLDLHDGRIIIFRCKPTILSPQGIDYSARGIPPDITGKERR